LGFNNVDQNGNPTNPITNELVNFGWEYVYHCHILSHEEMDMMRPVILALPPVKADGLRSTVSGNGNNTILTLVWNDNSITETSFVVQRNNGSGWVNLATIQSPLDQANTKGLRTYVDTTYQSNVSYAYQIVAQNTVGYGGAYMGLTVKSISDLLTVNPPAAPTNLTASLQAGPQVTLTWFDNATNETGFAIERRVAGGTFAQIATVGRRNNTGNVTFVNTGVTLGTTYEYRVMALGGTMFVSSYSNIATVNVSVPTAPSNFAAVPSLGNGNNRTVTLTWLDNSSNETGFTIQRATNATFTTGLNTATVGTNVGTLVQTGLARNTRYYYRIMASNLLGASVWVNATPFPVTTAP
jgi:hypothetical protein